MKFVPLSSLLSVQPRNGWSPPAEFQTGTGVPVLTLSSVTGFRYDGTKVKLSSAPTQEGAHYWLQKGDLLITRSNTKDLVGHAAIYDGTPSKAICCDLIMKMQVDPHKALTRFIHFYLQSPEARDYLTSRAQGANSTMSKIGKKVVQDTPIPSFSLPEQRRIVAFLEETFAAIATAKANAEKNLRNAHALLESHLNSIFGQQGAEWKEAPLRSCIQSLSTGPFGSIIHKSDYQAGGIPLINPINIKGEKIIPDSRKTVSEVTARRLARYRLQENDIVVSRRGEIGRCAVVARDQAGWLCGTGSFFIRPSQRTDPHFLAYLLRSRPYRERLEKVASRATMPSISNTDLANLIVRFPPISLQVRAVALVKNLSYQTARLAAIYEKKLAALEALKKSLLHQAFTGQL